MFIKIFYAFVWQEQFVPTPFWARQSKDGLLLASYLQPHVNSIASLISGFPQTDYNMRHSENVYPGDEYCNRHSSHSLWHSEAANGLVEIIFLADTVYGYTKAN